MNHLDKHQRIERKASEAISRRAAWDGDFTRQQLRKAEQALYWLASQSLAAYESMESPHDQHGNPTDYAGVEHQAMLTVRDKSDALDHAARIISRILDLGDIR